MKIYCYWLLCVLGVLCCSSLGAQQVEEEALTTLSLNINEKLQRLKQEMLSLQEGLQSTSERLTQASKNLTISENERLEWEQKSTTLSASLESINKQLNSSYDTIVQYKTRIDILFKWVIGLATFVFVLICGKLTGYFLYFKGIKVPRGIDILL